jgi:hypothetical protein
MMVTHTCRCHTIQYVNTYPYKDQDKAFSQVAALTEKGIPAVDLFAITSLTIAR